VSIADAIAHDHVSQQVTVLRGAEGLAQKLMAELAAAEEQVVAKLSRLDLTKFTRERTISTLNQIRQIMAEFSGRAYVANRDGASSIARAVAARAANDLNRMVNVSVFNPVLNANSLKRILDDRSILGGQTLSEFWKRQPSILTDAYSQVIRTGLISGASKGEMIDDVMSSAKIAANRGSIRTMVRTSVMEVANAARTDMYAENLDLVKGIQWLSTLDNRTSTICRGLDGLTWSLPDYEPINHDKRYPGSTAHPNCRSTQIPVLRSLEELATKNKKLARTLDEAMGPTARASMDGAVASDLSYEDWLAAKSSGEQRAILGDARYAMWKADGISLKDMLDQSGAPLTVQQLEQELKYPDGPRFPQEWTDDLTWHDSVNKDFLKRQLKLYNGTVPRELRDAVDDYIGSSYTRINAYLRQLRDPDTYVQYGVAQQTSKVRQALNQMPMNDVEVRLFRVVDHDLGLEIGDECMFEGMVSTTINPSLDVFVKPNSIAYDIMVPKGRVRLLPGHEFEKELIMDHGTVFVVHGIRMDKIGGQMMKVYEIEILQ